MAARRVLAKTQGQFLPPAAPGPDQACRIALQLAVKNSETLAIKWRNCVVFQVWHVVCIVGSGPNGLRREARPFLVSGLRLPENEKALRTGPAERFFDLRTRLRGCVLGAVPPLRSGRLRAAVWPCGPAGRFIATMEGCAGIGRVVTASANARPQLAARLARTAPAEAGAQNKRLKPSPRRSHPASLAIRRPRTSPS